MFTGLIQARARVIENNALGHANRLVIEAAWDDPLVGESIAINGVCLTLLGSSQFAFDVSQETLVKTNLSHLRAGEWVNLERAMSGVERFGGHYVTGHVDTVATLKTMQQIGDYLEITVSDFVLPNSQLYLVPKGSITLDWVSLTINEVLVGGEIKLMLIPHTLAMTTLGQVKSGHLFNVEFDYIARIVAHQLDIMQQLNQEHFSR